MAQEGGCDGNRGEERGSAWKLLRLRRGGRGKGETEPPDDCTSGVARGVGFWREEATKLFVDCVAEVRTREREEEARRGQARGLSSQMRIMRYDGRSGTRGREREGEGETHRRHRTTWPSDRSLPATQTMTPLASVPLKAPSTHDPHCLSLVVLVQTSSSLRDACAFVATHAEQRCVHPLPPLPCSRLHLLLRLFQSRSLAWPCLAFSPPLSHVLCPRCQCILPWCRRAWVGAPPKG